MLFIMELIMEFIVRLLLFLEFLLMSVDELLYGLLVMLCVIIILLSNVNLCMFLVMLILVLFVLLFLENGCEDCVLFVCLYFVMVFIKLLNFIILCKNIFLGGLFIEFFFLYLLREFVVF